MDRIYLDNAATSWPKPEPVYTAVDQAMREIGVSTGRSLSPQSSHAAQIVKKTRALIAEVIDVQNPDDIAFTGSGTDSLCTAIFGLLNDGDHVITTVIDHNSILRPLQDLAQAGKIQLTIVPCDEVGFVEPESVAAALTDRTALVAMTHASNVLGTVQPVREIGDVCRQRGVTFLLDAAQTIGHIPCSVAEIGCDILAAPGHKGLLGPLGTGVLYVRSDLAPNIRPLRLGGSGSQQVDEKQPEEMPSKFESGSLNVPAIAGLGAGVAHLLDPANAEQKFAAAEHTQRLTQALQELDGVKLWSVRPDSSCSNVGVVSFSVAGFDSTTIAGILDSTWNIQTRPGFHCAPLLHQQIGTHHDGLVRLSPGPFNTASEVQQTIDAITEMVQGLA